MRHEASRQIMWNVENWYDPFLMYLFLALAFILFLNGIIRRFEIWSSGKEADEFTGDFFERLKSITKGGLLQSGVVRDKIPALAHSLLYLGFIVLLFTTTMVLIHHDFGILIYQGNFYLAVTLLSDIFGLGALFGCFILIHRRYVTQPDQLHNKKADANLLVLITLLLVQGFVLEGLRIHVTNDPWAAYSPVGLLFAKFFWFLSEPAARQIHYFTWWFHTLTVYSAIVFFPYSKLFHIFASSINLFYKNSPRPKGQPAIIGNIEELLSTSDEISLGLGSIKDYTWKQLLDLDACTSCGRCQAACPAYNSGKPLSPKWLILDTRNHMLALASKDEFGEKSILPPLAKEADQLLLKNFLHSSGLEYDHETKAYSANGDYRAANSLTQNSSNQIGFNKEQMIAGEVIDTDVFWACTTCYACVEACPVGINHVDQIIGNRRNLTMMRGELPEEAQRTLRSLENRGNPYGPAEDRIKWTNGISVPMLKAGDEVEVLYWVGCVSSFDARKQKIAKALVQIFNKIGLSYGILGSLENCTGDPARRLGDENLFQVLAKQNIQTFKSIKFKKLVTNCPHCFNSFKNEYPEFGGISDEPVKILHHSQFLNQLLDLGTIKLEENDLKVTFHDPCYLGRYNDEYEAPRKSLKKIKGLQIIEMEKSKEKGLCCGAGGGHFWMDIKQGERVNFIRAEQAKATNTEIVSTACPFCMQMLEDGNKGIGAENLEVKDIAELICENLAQ